MTDTIQKEAQPHLHRVARIVLERANGERKVLKEARVLADWPASIYDVLEAVRLPSGTTLRNTRMWEGDRIAYELIPDEERANG